MTFLQLYGAQLDIELASQSLELFTTVRRKQAVNDAQRTFARMTGCTKRYATIAIVDGTAEYDLEAIAALDFIKLAGAPSVKIVSGSLTRYIQGKDSFPRRDPEELDQDEPNWRAASNGTPAFWYTREDGGSTYLGMNPPPSVGATETWSWLVPYIAEPPDMSASGDEPFTFSANPIKRLAVYHQGLVHYAAAQLEPLRKNYSGVTRQMQLYSGYIAQYLQDMREGGRDQITMQRNYLGESARNSVPRDPRSWP